MCNFLKEGSTDNKKVNTVEEIRTLNLKNDFLCILILNQDGELF